MNRQPYQTPPRWWAPKLSRRWVGVWRPLRRQRGYWMHGLTEIEVRGLEHIQDASDQGHSVLITPNHPTHADPFVLMEAADQLRQPFFFMTAWQVFATTHRIGRWVLRHHGAFSINREGADLRAMRQSIRVLEAGEHPLVIFPEGEVFHLNDRVMPFRRGAATLALRAARRANKTVACVPCGLKFHYTTDPTDSLLAVMDQLEKHLGWTPRRAMPLARRLERFADGVLCLKELEYFGTAQRGSLSVRIERLIATVLGRLEDRYSVAPGTRTVPERVKRVRQLVISEREAAPGDHTRRQQWDHDMNDLFFVMQLFSYPADYLSRSPSLERMAETIDKLEEDVLGIRTARRRGLRRAVVEFGPPLLITPGSYNKDHVTDLTRQMEAQVQGLLDGMSAPQPAQPAIAPLPPFEPALFTPEPTLPLSAA